MTSKWVWTITYRVDWGNGEYFTGTFTARCDTLIGAKRLLHKCCGKNAEVVTFDYYRQV